jgi:putative ABC transport system ATP-binding protein
MNIIQIDNISKTFGKGEGQVKALQNVSIGIKREEFIAIMGPSGSGKTTLLNMIGLLDKPDTGKYLLDNREITSDTSPNILAQLRREKIGFVFQTFNLLPRTSALDNVAMPAIYSGIKNRVDLAKKLLKQVGLEKRMKHHPSQMSGGEKQRVAIARALINNPQILIADEPTGNLDSKSEVEIMKIFTRLNKENGITVVMVTHEDNIAKHAQRIVRMRDGKIIK